MVLKEFGWFGGILEEFVRKTLFRMKKKKRIKSGLRARKRGINIEKLLKSKKI